MCVYAVLTDGHGVVPVTVRMIDVDEEKQPVFEVKAEASFPDPTIVCEVCLGVQNVTLPDAGEYRLQLMAGPSLLMERRILVRRIGDGADEPTA